MPGAAALAVSTATVLTGRLRNQHSGIANLSASLGIERRAIEDDLRRPVDRDHGGRRFERLAADEFGLGKVW